MIFERDKFVLYDAWNGGKFSIFQLNDNFAKSGVTLVNSIISIPPHQQLRRYWHRRRFASWLREDRNMKNIAFLPARSDFLTMFMSREIIKPCLWEPARDAELTVYARRFSRDSFAVSLVAVFKILMLLESFFSLAMRLPRNPS